ncbi:MAG TPA: hypothetical protein RMH80_07595 [Polyangiaceae bacterium LLY-WYZ-15_(1-7)]|nr:hypothetical protein [Polyangiaceae bacterium LLY-WYZ-15_(1-7)]
MRSPFALAPLAALLLALPLAGCGDDDGAPAGACTTAAECAGSERCVDGRCVPTPETDAGTGTDAGTPPCAAGQVRRDGVCANDCGDPSAVACEAGLVCNYATGACADAGASGLLTGEGEACGERTCLPGTECAGGECVAAPPCAATRCDESACWGRACASERPTALCAPAPLERMNEPDFIAGGDGGAFDLEFDDACNAYVVTMISGPDFLRQLEPDGTLTVWTGVTNLNMGEVAVLRRPGGEFGTGDGELGEVALTYVCCASCGCVGDDPQGVARLVRGATEELPMEVIATPSPGAGPWGVTAVDTGPYGLTYDARDRLYVGNVEANGDLVRADVAAGTSETLTTFEERVHATAVFGPRSILVALAGGAVVEVDTETGATTPFAELATDVTSMVRDPFTGRVYVSTPEPAIRVFTPDGEPLDALEAPPAADRLAYAPDGFLYYLVVGWPTTAQVLRYALPERLGD